MAASLDGTADVHDADWDYSLRGWVAWGREKYGEDPD